MRNTLGGRIRAARKHFGMTQPEFAKAVGVGAWTRVSEWENDRTTPRHKYLEAMARVLSGQGARIDMGWLITGTGTMLR